MLWLFLSLGAALSQAANDTLSKRYFSDLTAYEMGLIRLVFGFPIILTAWLLIPWPELDRTFFLCLICGLPLEVIALLCYMRALKVSPLSLSVPFLAFTPVFVILTGFLILDETLSPPGVSGILLIVLGSYVLNLSKAAGNLAAPIRAIFREQGSWLMLLTAAIYSVTATIGKLGIQHSSPDFFGLTYFLILTIILMLMLWVVPNAKYPRLFHKPMPGIFSGFFLTTMIFSHMFAIAMIQAAYMISIKRSSLIFGVILGALVFKEEKIKERLLGATIMMVGILTIGFLG